MATVAGPAHPTTPLPECLARQAACLFFHIFFVTACKSAGYEDVACSMVVRQRHTVSHLASLHQRGTWTHRRWGLTVTTWPSSRSSGPKSLAFFPARATATPATPFMLDHPFYMQLYTTVCNYKWLGFNGDLLLRNLYNNCMNA